MWEIWNTLKSFYFCKLDHDVSMLSENAINSAKLYIEPNQQHEVSNAELLSIGSPPVWSSHLLLLAFTKIFLMGLNFVAAHS